MNQQTRQKKQDSKRRNLLKALAAGGGVFTGGAFLPTRWTRPVVDTVMLPAHAQTTLIGCDAVFCDLSFAPPGGIGGAAEVEDGILFMLGGSEAGDWFGSGPVAPDGTFSILVTFESDLTAQATGFVEEGCVRILGTLDLSEGGDISFSGSISGLTSIELCNLIITD